MKCRACDAFLSDYEASVRSVITRDYVMLCKVCLESIKTDLLAVGNPSLMSEADEINETGSEGFDDLFDPYADSD